MPPNRLGIAITIFTCLVFLNFLSIVETVAMPLVVIDKSNNFNDSVGFLTFNFSYPYLLFMCIGLTAAVAFLFYKSSIINQTKGTEFVATND